MITSYLQLLRRYQGNLSDDKADKYIHFAVDGAVRMQNLINDLLKFSRVSTSTRELENTNCELILNQTLSNLKLIIKDDQATFTAMMVAYMRAYYAMYATHKIFDDFSAYNFIPEEKRKLIEQYLTEQYLTWDNKLNDTESTE
jgi:light-regulated signal transduction histidine kinase (bacteriophytochrome)